MNHFKIIALIQIVIASNISCALSKEADQPKQILRPGPIGGQPPIYGRPLGEEQEPNRGGGINKDKELPPTRDHQGSQPTIIQVPSRENKEGAY